MNSQSLIDQLSEDIAPVKPLSVNFGRWLALGAAAISIAVLLATFGVRDDLAVGTPSPVVLLVAGLFALTAIASGLTATRLARPAVGASQGGALWMTGAIALLPAISLLEFALGAAQPTATDELVTCLQWGITASLLTLAVLTWRLKQGAPVLPERAGLYAGLSAGAVGAFAITLECNNADLLHLALSHVAVVAGMALAGRLIVARLIRW